MVGRRRRRQGEGGRREAGRRQRGGGSKRMPNQLEISTKQTKTKYTKSMEVMRKRPNKYQNQLVIDIVDHHVAIMDTRGHDIIIFYMQRETSHSTGTGHNDRL